MRNHPLIKYVKLIISNQSYKESLHLSTRGVTQIDNVLVDSLVSTHPTWVESLSPFKHFEALDQPGES